MVNLQQTLRIEEEKQLHPENLQKEHPLFNTCRALEHAELSIRILMKIDR